jgi:hypothetical protein
MNFSLIGVRNLNDYKLALTETSPDVILFDYSGSFTDGPSALTIAMERVRQFLLSSL